MWEKFKLILINTSLKIDWFHCVCVCVYCSFSLENANTGEKEEYMKDHLILRWQWYQKDKSMTSVPIQCMLLCDSLVTLPSDQPRVFASCSTGLNAFEPMVLSHITTINNCLGLSAAVVFVNHFQEEKRSWFVVFAYVHSVNTPTVSVVKLPMWCHEMQQQTE